MKLKSKVHLSLVISGIGFATVLNSQTIVEGLNLVGIILPEGLQKGILILGYLLIFSGIVSWLHFKRRLLRKYKKLISNELVKRIIFFTSIVLLIIICFLKYNPLPVPINEPYLTEGNLLLYPPTHNRVKVRLVLPIGHSQVEDTCGEHIVDKGKKNAFYKIAHLLEVENKSLKTIRNLRLHLYEHLWRRSIEIPIYNQAEKAIDLDPGQVAQFEIAYQFTLKSNKRCPEVHKDLVIDENMLNGIYYHLKTGGYGPGSEKIIGEFGTLDIGRADPGVADATPITEKEIKQWTGFMWPLALQLSGNDIPLQHLILTVVPNKEAGFELKIIPSDTKPVWIP